MRPPDERTPEERAEDQGQKPSTIQHEAQALSPREASQGQDQALFLQGPQKAQGQGGYFILRGVQRVPAHSRARQAISVQAPPQ